MMLRNDVQSELEQYTFQSAIRGYHVFKTTYESNIGDKLSVVGVTKEANDQHDKCTVFILKHGHLN